jgi:hypothetical protein
MDKAEAPIPLLRELRRVFEYDAGEYRKREQASLSTLEQKALGARAYACENVVRKIDATLRDWA